MVMHVWCCVFVVLKRLIMIEEKHPPALYVRGTRLNSTEDSGGRDHKKRKNPSFNRTSDSSVSVKITSLGERKWGNSPNTLLRSN